MSTFRNSILFISIVAFAGASGFAVQRHFAGNNTDRLNTAGGSLIGERRVEDGTIRPEFAMLDIEGNMRNIREWDGKVILLNFWATWCPPCMKEIPDFIELQNEYGEQGLQIIGIAIDDETLVRQYVEKSGMNYPVMASEIDAIELSRRYGNQIGGLPYTAVINQKGEITRKITGELDKIRAEKILEELGLDV